MEPSHVNGKESARNSASPEESSLSTEGLSAQPPAFQLMASSTPPPPPPADNNGVAQRKAGGMPTDLVNGFAASTGHDLSDVNVHYNSAAPSHVGALAYAQGNDIHLGPGQEQHLGHEAGHIVQQREGRVQANTSVGGMPVNDNAGLESEADSMGAKAAQMKMAEGAAGKASHASSNAVQRQVAPIQMEGPEDMDYIDYTVIPAESYVGGSIEVQAFARLLQRSMNPARASSELTPRIQQVWPAIANILHAGIDGSNPHPITDPTSAHNPASYGGLTEGDQLGLQKFHQARWNCQDRRSRNQLIGEGRRAITGGILLPWIMNAYIIESAREEVSDYFDRLVHDRLSAIVSEPFWVQDAAGNLTRYVAPVRERRARASTPTDPREPEFQALGTAVVDSRLEPSTLPRYRTIAAANMAAESGDTFTPSRVGTSAGRPASIGRSQLLVREQIDRCRHYLSGETGTGTPVTAAERPHFETLATRLREAGMTVEKLDDIHRRGHLMESLHIAITTGDLPVVSARRETREHRELRDAMETLTAAGMDAESIRAMGLSRDEAGLAAEGDALEAALDPEHNGRAEAAISGLDLRAMSAYNEVRRGHLEFRDLLTEYKAAHAGANTREETVEVITADTNARYTDVRGLLTANPTFTITSMVLDRNAAAIRTYFRSLPSIAPLVTILRETHAGDSNEMDDSSIDRHMSRNITREDRNGWYTRGAMNSPHWPEFEAVLTPMDRFTTEERHLNNYERALRAASGFTGWDALPEQGRTAMLGQMSRVNHGGPGDFQSWFESDDRPVHSIEEYRAHIATLYDSEGVDTHSRGRGIFSWTRHYCEQNGLNPTLTEVEIFLPTAARARMQEVITNAAAAH